MSRVKIGIALLALVLLVAGWYAFRPERAFIDAPVSEAAPQGDLRTIATGRFEPRTHKGRGDAAVMRRPDGSLVVRFSSFETLNGPDVRVYLLGAADAANDRELESAGHLDLGPLKGNVGDQNYDIPAGTELTRYRAVAVWCRRFGVNFTTAGLSPVRDANGKKTD